MNSPRIRVILIAVAVVLALGGALLLAATRQKPVVAPPQPTPGTQPPAGGNASPGVPAPTQPAPQPPPPGWEAHVRELQARIDRNPKDQSAYAELGSMYLYVRRYEDAMPPLLRAVELNMKDGTSWFNLATCYQSQFAYDLFADALERCLAAQPSMIEAYRALADVYERIGLSPSRAIVLLREAYRRGPTDLPNIVALASALLRTGEDATRAEGGRLVDEAYRLAPHEPGILSLKAYSAFLKDNFVEAEQYAQEGLSLTPDSVELHMMMADIITTGEQHDLREVIRHLQIIIRLQPTRHDAYLMLAQTFRRLGQDDKAYEVLRGWERMAPSASEEVYQMLGDILQDQGKTAEAKTYHDQAEARRAAGERIRTMQAKVLANPGDVPAAIAMAAEFAAQGGHLAAIIILEEAAKASPRDPRPYLELEQLYRASGRTKLADEARAAARRRGAP